MPFVIQGELYWLEGSCTFRGELWEKTLMASTAWWNDFHIRHGVVHVKKTGIDVPVEPGVIQETLTWLVYYARIESLRPGIARTGPKVWFAPDKPRPWYLIWPVFQLSGLQLARTLDEADLIFTFEDRTCADIESETTQIALNSKCLDVSKSRVAEAFKTVSGRDLAVIPDQFHGPMVSKSEGNGVHDGRVVHGPIEAEPGQVYQRLINNEGPSGLVEDLRCPTVGGNIPLVFIKRRETDRRFANANSEVLLKTPSEVFSEAELSLLRAFCREMGLDWGGIDVLRDRSSGELWVVDVNKTDMGPPIALSLTDKLKSTRILADSLSQLAKEIVSGETVS